MKKIFVILAIATTGMLTSCGSGNDAKPAADSVAAAPKDTAKPAAVDTTNKAKVDTSKKGVVGPNQ
jgi:hypothetical protein